LQRIERSCTSRSGPPKSVRHELRISLGVLSAARSSERSQRPAEAADAEGLVAKALAALADSNDLATNVGRPALDEAARPRLHIDSGAQLAASLRPVLAATSSDCNAVDSGAKLLNTIATMSPDAVRLAHRALVWNEELRLAAESGRHLLIEGCAWGVSDDETLELTTVRDAITGHDVPVPAGLGVLAYVDPSHRLPSGVEAMRTGTTGLRIDVLGRPRRLNDLEPDLLVLLEVDALAVWSSS
jgi:hypothetical protein